MRLRKNSCKLNVWENGKKSIKKFMKSAGCSYFTFSKILTCLGLSGNLDIVRSGSDSKIRVYKENNEHTDIEFINNKPGYMQISTGNDSKLYRIVKNSFFHASLECV